MKNNWITRMLGLSREQQLKELDQHGLGRGPDGKPRTNFENEKEEQAQLSRVQQATTELNERATQRRSDLKTLQASNTRMREDIAKKKAERESIVGEAEQMMKVTQLRGEIMSFRSDIDRCKKHESLLIPLLGVFGIDAAFNEPEAAEPQSEQNAQRPEIRARITRPLRST